MNTLDTSGARSYSGADSSVAKLPWEHAAPGLVFMRALRGKRGGGRRKGRVRALFFEPLESRLCLSVGAIDPAFFNSSPLAPPEGEPPAAISTNVALSTDPGVQHFPSVAANPLDPNHVVVAYMDYSLLTSGYAGIGVAVSRDGGATWQRNSIPLPAGFDQGASDPVVHFDHHGHPFVSFMAAKFLAGKPPILNPGSGAPRALGFKANNGIFVVRSEDGGTSWQTPVAVASHSYDGTTEVPFEIFPDMAIDVATSLPSGEPNPHAGNLYVTWSRYYPAGQFPGEANSIGGSEVMIAVSTDHGLTWQLRTQTTAAGIERTVLESEGNTGLDQPAGRGYDTWARVTVGPEGDVSVADYVGSWFLVSHSTDAAASFFVPSQGGRVGLPFGPGTKLLTSGLTNNSFRANVAMRAIAADPTRPGRVYAAEPLSVLDSAGNPLDAADIFFARSEDYGKTWTRTIVHGAIPSETVNDDNDGQKATGNPDDVTADQFMVRLRVSLQGEVGLFWYDTRRDLANHSLDVFGAVSTDGGHSFSPNFRVTDQSFDADAGEFTDANANPNFFIGDGIGLAMAQGAAYVAWTDTRAGNQDIVFRRVPLDPLPAPPNDRLEPNDVLASAADVGSIVTKHLAKLALAPGDEDWFRVQSLATGEFEVTVNVSAGEDIELEIREATSLQVLAHGMPVSNDGGQVVGWRASVPSEAEQTFVVRVRAAAAVAEYSLDLASLTADLGPIVFRQLAGELQAGQRRLYSLQTTAAGVLTAELTPEADARGEAALEILKPGDLSVVAAANGAAPLLRLSVQPGEPLLVRLSAEDAARFFRFSRAPLQVIVPYWVGRVDFSRHSSGVQWDDKSDPRKETPPVVRLHHWRTVDPDIPCQDASQQSLIPFFRAARA